MENELDPEDPNRNPPQRKPGRPKGSKDGPRYLDAPKRGRPMGKDVSLEADTADRGPSTPSSTADDEDRYEFEYLAPEIYQELYAQEKDSSLASESGRQEPSVDDNISSPPPGTLRASPNTENHVEQKKQLTLKQLCDAAEISQTRPFFSSQASFLISYDSDDEDDEETEDREEESNKPKGAKQGNKAAATGDSSAQDAWFNKPKLMSSWLYAFFIKEVSPLIFGMDGTRYVRPAIFQDRGPHLPGSLWMHPQDPIMSLHSYRFEPETLYRPRIFFWLPHFFVDGLRCPNCPSRVLEKNGACPPRRIVDIEDVFWIVTWSYYCRKGCGSHFRGWNPAILDSLPPYLRLSFPAVLSQRSGLSHRVISQLRVGNQHKMGPSGVRSLLLEMHTRKFNVLQVQYLEAVYELVRGRQNQAGTATQSSMHSFWSSAHKSFGDFSDPEKYGGFVPSEFYLARMMNKSIERDEVYANQHTSCLAPDQISIDDSHKVNKHIAKVEGVPIFNALWTCMDSRYIRAQALTLTKAHEERNGPLKGIANSIKRYGFSFPKIAFSDDPLKDRRMLHENFPSLAEKLTPLSAAYGLKPLELPHSLSITVLTSPSLVESALLSVFAPLESDPTSHICISFDAEWNISRTEGVSIIQIAPHSMPDSVFIIPVYRFKNHLPTSLVRLLISKQVFKIGANIKGDLTRLRKQFPAQLSDNLNTTNVIDLKEYCIARGIIARKASGSLDVLCEKALGLYLTKPDFLRKHNSWETSNLSKELLDYAALDVLASRLIFEKASERLPIQRPSFRSPPGTKVALLLQEGGDPIAYGKIAQMQPNLLGSIRVKTPLNNRVVIDIDTILNPSAAAILHIAPTGSQQRSQSTKSGALTLGELRALAPSDGVLQIVTSVALLDFDQRDADYNNSESAVQEANISSFSGPSSTSEEVDAAGRSANLNSINSLNEADTAIDDNSNIERIPDSEPEIQHAEDENEVSLDMLEAHSSLLSEKQRGKQHAGRSTECLDPLSQDFVSKLRELVDSPPDIDNEYTRVKKDIFHAFHMIPTPVNHGLRAAYSRALRDHMMRWDPIARSTVDETCRRVFNLTFDQMLARNPRFIMERTPRFVPPPSVLVPAISHVFNTFGDALDAKTGAPLFNKVAWQKANAVLDLARQGYLSDNQDVTLYEKAGVDKHGLQKWKCLRGTNNVEGGPHGDIYRKFGALNAGPRLTVNCLTDHRTWYNLQAYAKHLYGVDWEYHHDLALINRTSFLLNYLSDVVGGARSYGDWINGDLYERTEEQFGICKFPESLRLQLEMDVYNPAASHQLNPSDDWLRQRQDLALPVLPPTTPEARQYFFTEIVKHVAAASKDGKSNVDYSAFAQEWNRSADGKFRFYVTPEVLAAYAKTWEKNNNIKASQDLIADALDVILQTSEVFSATNQMFPDFLTALPSSIHPLEGVLEDTSASAPLPASLSTSLAISQPALQIPTPTPVISRSHSLLSFFTAENPNAVPPENDDTSNLDSGLEYLTPPMLTPSVSVDSFTPAVHQGGAGDVQRPTKRRRVVPEAERKRSSVRTCRRCHQAECPGNSDILKCLVPCTVPCAKCGQTEGCRGVDKGKKCTAVE